MKISKLFHWLYAILMFLPFAFFVPSVLYYAFNDNATMQSVEVPKTDTIAVDFNQKLGQPVESSFYTWNDTYITFDNSGFIGQYVNIYNLVGADNHIVYFKVTRSDVFANQGSTYQIYWLNINNQFEGVPYASDYFYGIYSNPNGNLSLRVYNEDIIGKSMSFQFFDLTKMFGVGNEPTKVQFDEWFPNPYYSYTESELMQITYETGTTEQLVENTSIINYAWESIWDLPLFSWTKVTFVSVPFSYLTGIFGIGASNSLNYVFGYFVTISIVWLVFDLLLYVPMLAHNWIDKARIE